MDYRISLVGLFIGFLVGLTGMGGGALLAPIMILLFRIPPVWAVGTDIAYSTVTKAVGSIVHIRQKNVNFKVALWLACGSVPATLLSVSLVQYLRKHYADFINNFILHTIGFTLLLVAVLLIVKPFIMRRIERKNLEAQKQAALRGEPTTTAPSKWEKLYRPMLTIFVGAFVGCRSHKRCFTGDGGGIGLSNNSVEGMLEEGGDEVTHGNQIGIRHHRSTLPEVQ